MSELFPRILFVLLSVAIILPIVPFKWSLFSYLIVVHLNLLRPDFASNVSLGIENTVRLIALPTILLLRTRFAGLSVIRNALPFRLWIGLCIYAGITLLWTPFLLSAVKQLGYFYVYTVTLLLLVYAFSTSRKDTYRIIAWSIVAVIILAFIQTYLLGNQWGLPGLGRFTTYTPAQSFGLYLVIIFAVVVSIPRHYIKGVVPRVILLILVIIALFLNGSRTGFVAFLVVATSAILLRSMADRRFRRMVAFLGAAGVIFAALAIIFLAPTLNRSEPQDITQSPRLLQLFEAVSGEFSLYDIGTFRFRIDMYQTVLGLLQQRPLEQIVFGSGTSSAAEIITDGHFYYRGYDYDTVGANSVIHNEFLRAIYEWGIVGLVLFTLMLAVLFIGAVRIANQTRSFEGYMLLPSLFVVLLSIMLNNPLAASGNPEGLAITLVIAQLAVQRWRLNHATPLAEGVQLSGIEA